MRRFYMKKFCKFLFCLLMCFSFLTFVSAEEELGADDYVGENEDAFDDDWSDDEDSDDDWSDDEYSDDEYSDDEESYEDDLYKDANEENSQTSDIPIILISSIAIISLIIVLSKNSSVFNTNKNF